MVLPPGEVRGQADLRGYVLGVASWAQASDFLPEGATWFGRGRVMPSWEGRWISVEAAYEHVFQRQPAGGGFGITNPGGGPVSTDWLPLGWTIRETDRFTWRHDFDRLFVRVSRGPVEVTLGRQAISWATTLFLTPADPFAPFDPSDPFREYRGGVDAARVRGFVGPFTEVEAVVRPADTPQGTTMTALGRVGTSRGGWAFGVWGGLLHDEGAGAAFATGGLGATSLRTEIVVRRGRDGGALLRASLGFDRFFQVADRDLQALMEIQYDGYGASSPAGLLDVARSPAFGRGDLQVLGRWTAAAQASYQVHPLVGVDVLALVNLLDPSLLAAPGLTWSATSSSTARMGFFLGVGPGAPNAFSLGSEYGSVPSLAYLSVSLFL